MAFRRVRKGVSFPASCIFSHFWSPCPRAPLGEVSRLRPSHPAPMTKVIPKTHSQVVRKGLSRSPSGYWGEKAILSSEVPFGLEFNPLGPWEDDAEAGEQSDGLERTRQLMEQPPAGNCSPPNQH